MSDSKQCGCPMRPYFNPGSLGGGSGLEDKWLRRWQDEHGGHEYALARDELVKAIQAAEGRIKSGEAVLDMVQDIFNLPRYSRAPTAAGEVVREASRRAAALAREEQPGGEYTSLPVAAAGKAE